MSNTSEKVDLWMPFYVGDYLADTMHLSAAEHGGYLMLILHYWKSGPIPNDSARLATISRLGDAWSDASSTILAFFKQCNGMLVHERIDREKSRASEYKDKKTARAKAGAAKRWGGNATSNAASNQQAMLNDMHKQCPSPSHELSTKVDNKKDSAFDAKAMLQALGVSDKLIGDFLKVRKAKKAPLTETALEKIINEATKARLPIAEAIKICCEKNWQGFEASWLQPEKQQPQATKPAMSDKFNVGNMDYSSTDKAQAESFEKHGIRPQDYADTDQIDF